MGSIFTWGRSGKSDVPNEGILVNIVFTEVNDYFHLRKFNFAVFPYCDVFIQA
uniref:Uncharacterized protein n=1 Tax=Anguilla anguilla TaxID=7936 RepID=A0A0E9VXA7_ANGAN